MHVSNEQISRVVVVRVLLVADFGRGVMSSLGSDAGHVHGNFPRYYAFNPVEKRLSLLEGCEESPGLEAVLVEMGVGGEEGVSFVDVGSNSGDLSVGIGRWLADRMGVCVRGLGVELDGALVERAKEMWKEEEEEVDGVEMTFVQTDLTDAEEKGWEAWLGEGGQADVVFCFGVTMWIHVHVGDEGLKAFIRRLCATAASLLVLEVHVWKNYQTCKKRLKRQKLPLPPALASLPVRLDVEDWVVSWITQRKEEGGCGMRLVADLGRTNWNRPICVFAPPDTAPRSEA